jgi:hypothetical protein
MRTDACVRACACTIARRFAQEQIGPKVAQMDRDAELDKHVLKGMFDNGFMGIETPEEFGGAGMSFTGACLVVEEFAKVDPAVSVVCRSSCSHESEGLDGWVDDCMLNLLAVVGYAAGVRRAKHPGRYIDSQTRQYATKRNLPAPPGHQRCMCS